MLVRRVIFEIEEKKIAITGVLCSLNNVFFLLKSDLFGHKIKLLVNFISKNLKFIGFFSKLVWIWCNFQQN